MYKVPFIGYKIQYQNLKKENIDVEVVDLRTIKPLDKRLILNSAKKTGKVIIVDATWETCGVAAEISALISENVFKYLKSPIKRAILSDIPAPASSVFEKEYFINEENIIKTARNLIK